MSSDNPRPGGVTALRAGGPRLSDAPDLHGSLEVPVKVPLWRGVWTVASLDLRQRVRTARTRWVLGAWIAVVYGFVFLTWLAVRTAPAEAQPPVFYGATMCVVLSIALLVTPSLAANAISGDRADAVLATLQVSLLGPLQIALGKLCAAWLTGMAFLGLALPVLLWAVAGGGVAPETFLLGLLVLAVVVLTVCAVGLAISAVTARVISSVVLTYLVVGFLVLGLPFVFGMSMPLVQEKTEVRVLMMSDTGPGCVERTQTRDVARYDRTWWLLAPNPFVIVGDAAPARIRPESYSADEPLGMIREGVRAARRGPEEPLRECWATGDAQLRHRDRQAEAPAWPIGLGLYAVATVGCVALATRRLRTPVGRLARGTRIA